MSIEQFNAITIEQMETSEIFYSIPKVLLEDEKYKELRLDSKMLYAILKDRLKLSAKNRWIDEQGRVYLEYSNKELQEIFNCSKHTIIKIRADLVKHGLIFEESQFTKADGQVANRIYVGNVIDYDSEKYRLERQKRQEEAFQKRQAEKLHSPRVKNARGESTSYTGAVSDMHPNNIYPSDIDSSKGIISSRKPEDNSDELPQSAGADHPPTPKTPVGFVPPQYYSLLELIATAYNNRCFGFPECYTMTHPQKMKIGHYLASNYVTSQEVIDLIGRVPDNSTSPLAYLYQSIENLIEARKFEARNIAHQQAEAYYRGLGKEVI